MINLQPEYLEQVKYILRQHIPDYKVWAYGSRIHKRVHKYSDLDLAIVGSSPLAAGKMSAIKEAFAVSDLPIMIDVRDLQMVSEHFRNIIKSGHEVIQNPQPDINPE